MRFLGAVGPVFRGGRRGGGKRGVSHGKHGVRRRREWLARQGICKSLLQARCEPRQNFEEIPHDREIGDVVDGCLGVGVDRDDGLCRTNARQVLNSTRNPCAEVDFGRYGLAAEPHLMRVGDPASVHGFAACADDSAEGACELADELEIVGLFKAAAACDDDARSFEVFEVLGVALEGEKPDRRFEGVFAGKRIARKANHRAMASRVGG